MTNYYGKRSQRAATFLKGILPRRAIFARNKVTARRLDTFAEFAKRTQRAAVLAPRAVVAGCDWKSRRRPEGKREKNPLNIRPLGFSLKGETFSERNRSSASGNERNEFLVQRPRQFYQTRIRPVVLCRDYVACSRPSNTAQSVLSESNMTALNLILNRKFVKKKNVLFER